VLRGQGCEVRAVAVTPDGRSAVSGGADGRLAVWDLQDGRLVRRQAGCRRPVRAVLVTPDGQRILAGGGEPWSVRASWFYTHFNPTLRAWSFETGKKVPLAFVERNLRMVSALAITVDGLHLAADVSYAMWDEVLGSKKLMLERGCLWVWGLGAEAHTRRRCFHEGSVAALAISRDGRLAVTGGDGRDLSVWDLERRTELARLPGHGDTVTSLVVFDGDTRLLSGSRDGSLLSWRLLPAGDSAPMLLGGHDGGIDAIAVTPDGRIAVSGGADCLLRAWRLWP
jgi:WD40 repeat protein